jgi:flagellar protein FliS
MPANPKARYIADVVSTASPARLVVMLYDRLLVDVTHGRDALQQAEWPEADRHLRHAQDVVTELLRSLRVDAWEGGPRLAAIYGWLLKELVLANVNRDAGKAQECLDLAQPLRDAWHGAALELMAKAG